MSNESPKAILIDYQFCTGCHVCEVACKKEHKLDEGQFGIRVFQDGPRQKPDGKWELNYIPVPTELCDLCAERTATGKKPRCVHHCQSLVMSYGTVEELSQKMDKGKLVLFTLAQQ